MKVTNGKFLFYIELEGESIAVSHYGNQAHHFHQGLYSGKADLISFRNSGYHSEEHCREDHRSARFGNARHFDFLPLRFPPISFSMGTIPCICGMSDHGHSTELMI